MLFLQLQLQFQLLVLQLRGEEQPLTPDPRARLERP